MHDKTTKLPLISPKKTLSNLSRTFIRNALITTGLSTIFMANIASANVDKTPPIKLYTFECGTIKVSDMDVFSSTGDYAKQEKTLSGSCFLIRHPKGDLLWDTGLSADLVGQKPIVNGVFTLTMAKTLPQQLAEIGLSPQDIEYVSISHSHFDHVGQLPTFKSSTWLAQKQEVTAMFGSQKSRKEFAALTTFKPKQFSGDLDVFNDGSVVILDTPGHTHGHTALQIMLPKTGPVLLSGDLYHQATSRDLKRVPRFNSDEPQTRVSMTRFEKIANKLGAKVIIQHEKSHIDSLPKLPKYLQ